MKVTIKKEIDVIELIAKLEEVLSKSMKDKAQAIIDKDDIKDVINVLKYFDNDYQVYKNETLKKAEKLEEQTENFKEQMKMMEESRNNQNRSVIERMNGTGTPDCYTPFSPSEMYNKFGEAFVQSAIDGMENKTMCDDYICDNAERCRCDCSRERKTITELKAIRDCFGKYTIGESWERECCDCKYVRYCLHETAEKKVSENE